jgi:hypothetical protein
MAHETSEWSVPAPVRMLMWWPAISFVLVIVDPDAATGGIVVAGAALALLGGLLAAAARRLRAGGPALAAEGPALEETTIEITPGAIDLPTAEIPVIDSPTGRRAA